ncbi:MAG: peptidase M61, partial [Bacteroidota bacterium]
MNVQENKWFLKVVIFFLFTGLNSQTAYKYYIDISKINNDEIKVRLSVPELKSKIVRFCFPAMVPGTYSIYDFGRFVKNFNVLDKNKKKISFEKKDVNTFLINDASEISEINYTVEDSWDTKDTGEIIFEPAGTKFDEGKHFILNNQGIFGYIGGMEKIPLEIEVVKPLKFYPATGNSNISLGEKKDVLKFGSYHELVDSPILYSVPDTTTINVAGSKVLIAVVSPSKKINSKFIARTIYDILEAQKNYLGGKLPVEKYAFLFYFTDSITKSGNMGALEHSYSSLYVLYDSDSSSARQMVRDVAAHEFFHIVTPLNIHSEEIGSFDFNNPKMSMHLWLYEGMTEYAAHHVQVMNGLIEPDDFFETIREKMNNSKDYFNDTLSFTNMSKGCLNTYKNQYGNVYEKGALISMCLDILLNYYSNGEYNTRKLMSDLSTKYGKNISFRDEDLFNDIEKLTFREIRIFLDNHVQGNRPLPFQDIFNKVGILFNAELVQEEITLGGFDIGYDDVSQHLVVESTMDINEFGKSMGYKEGDEIIKFRGKEINLTNANEIFYEFIEKAQVGETLEVE